MGVAGRPGIGSQPNNAAISAPAVNDAAAIQIHVGRRSRIITSPGYDRVVDNVNRYGRQR